MDSRARTLTAHLTYRATPRDDVRLFAQSDALSFPVVGRAALVNGALEQASRSTLLSTTWDRTARVGLTWSANVTYAIATSEAAMAGMPILATMERLRDGPVGELAASTSGRRHRNVLQLARRSGSGDLAGAASSSAIRSQSPVDRRQAKRARTVAHRRARGWRTRACLAGTRPTARPRGRAAGNWRSGPRMRCRLCPGSISISGCARRRRRRPAMVRQEGFVAGSLAEHQRHVARPSGRPPDVPPRRGPIRRAPAAQLSELRRSPWPDGNRPSLG